MPNSVAEAYLLILRPTSYMPVVGEAVPLPFNEQIEIDEWNWTMENEALVTRTARRDKIQADLDAADDEDDDDDDNKGSKPKKQMGPEEATSLARLVSQTQKDPRLSPAAKEREIRKLMNRLTSAVESDEQAEAAKQKKKKQKKGDGDDKLKFTFKKNVDAATTQLLNSMKAGDVMPRAILTLFHRSTNAPVTLAIKFEKVRLKSYSLSVDPSETMADLKEEWTATYETVEYTYQNRPAASGPNGLTKGTVRVFKMKGGSLI